MRRSLIAAVALFASTTTAFACGTERWAVKTGTDADAATVALTPEPVTIGNLAALPAPAEPNVRPTSRFAPVELKVYQISAVLSVIKREKDEDYHLVLSDPNDGTTMIVESPNPPCAAGSRFATQIVDVRATIDDHFGPIRGKRRPGIPVVVTGIAFFDALHGQEGVADNGIELHPLLSIQFQ